MQILENYDLTDFNTFRIKIKAKFFVSIKYENDFLDLIKNSIFKENKRLFLGGGSNILFIEDFAGLVIFNNLKGINILKENDDFVWVYSQGGENWDDLVDFTTERNLWGIENLAKIPGSVGASPVQNIGAYGVELKDSLEEVHVIDIENGEKRIFANEECKFGYRESVFKNELKDKYFIYAISLKLSKKPKINTDYRVLQKYIQENNLEIKTSKDVSLVVSKIRASKLPDPKVLGNAGSFFKNTFINQDKLDELLKIYPDLSFFKEGDNIKIPTAWLIESCGFKGEVYGNVGSHKDQALIIVNYGNATGQEIKNFSDKIIDKVYEKFGIQIKPEVNLI